MLGRRAGWAEGLRGAGGRTCAALSISSKLVSGDPMVDGVGGALTWPGGGGAGVADISSKITIMVGLQDCPNLRWNRLQELNGPNFFKKNPFTTP